MPKVEVEPVAIESRQERRARERAELKQNLAIDRERVTANRLYTHTIWLGKKARREEREAKAREKARVERVNAKAKPLYPKKEKQEQETK